LFPKARIIGEEEDNDLPDNIKPCLQPDEVLREIENKKIFSEEMLKHAARLRKHSLYKYY